MPDYKTQLASTVDNLYAVFAPYQAHTPAVSWHTLSTYATLTEKPVSALTVADLTPLVCQLERHADSAAMLRRFLPRILELSIEQHHRWAMGLERVFGCFKIADWHQWSETEQTAVLTFFEAFWRHHLYDVMPVGTLSSADTILEAFGKVVAVEPYLNVWQEMTSVNATVHMASLTVYGKKQHEDVRRWLLQPIILHRIEAAFWDCHTATHAALFAKAAEYLRLDELDLHFKTA